MPVVKYNAYYRQLPSLIDNCHHLLTPNIAASIEVSTTAPSPALLQEPDSIHWAACHDMAVATSCCIVDWKRVCSKRGFYECAETLHDEEKNQVLQE